MSENVRRHYGLYPYPKYPLLASIDRCSTYALNLTALWARFNGVLPPPELQRILIAGCGSFAPYPFALANPGTAITALDLSRRSLRRARMHCLLHGLRNVAYIAGDLCAPEVAPGPYGMIDAFGVLHHLEDPQAGLASLVTRLGTGGILRVMVYSRFARREEESIRRALRLLRVRRPEQVLDMVRRSKQGSRLRRFFEASDEMTFRAGVADALLHPRVHTFRINELMEIVAASGLEPLLFAHASALPDVPAEVERIRDLEVQGGSPGNFVLYLRKPGSRHRKGAEIFTINPCLSDAVSRWRLWPLQVPGRLGHRNQPLDAAQRRFLRRFRNPVRAEQLSAEELERAQYYCEQLFLLRYAEQGEG